MLGLLVAVLTAPQDPARLAAPPRSPLAFVGARVVDSERQDALEDATVLVERGRVVALGARAQVPVPEGFTTVEAKGLFLAPGLFDAHGHPPDAEPDDKISEESWLLLNLLGGVTTLRSMRGTEAQLALRARLERGLALGPRLLVAGMVTKATADDARAQVVALAEKGYDLVKLLGTVDVPTFRALARTAAAHGLHFAGHVPAGVPVDELAAAGYGVEHLHGFLAPTHSGQKLRELARLSARAGLAHDPTSDFTRVSWQLEPLERMLGRAGLAWVPAADRERWKASLEGDNAPRPEDQERAKKLWAQRLVLLKELADAKAPLLVSASHGPFIVPGLSMVEEMQVFVEAGLTPVQIFAAATRPPARCCRGEEVGVVRVGAHASFVLLGKDPRVDVGAWRDLRAVVVDGRHVAREALVKRLDMLAKQP